MASSILVPRLGGGSAAAVITEWFVPDGAMVRSASRSPLSLP